MDSIAKTLDNDDDHDRISDLPDEILCRILSFLPTKHAVATTILSTRWKNLFGSSPNLNCLNFDDSLLLHPTKENDADSLFYDREAHETSFINFMNRVLNVILLHVRTIPVFYLNCGPFYHDGVVESWIRAAVRLNVVFLDLNVSIVEDPDLLFDSLDGCTTLKYLTLRETACEYPPFSFCLPNLKSLLLESVTFGDDIAIETLITGCPVIYELIMRDCDLTALQVLRISAPSLEYLVIEDCCCEGSFYAIELDTPALCMLTLNDYVATAFVVKKNLNSLTKAHIDVGPTEWQQQIVNEHPNLNVDHVVVDLVAACSMVEFLSLSKDSIEAIRRSSRPMPVFRNLTHLQLAGFGTGGWEVMPQLLESAPKLELLDIT